jgi:hypothetical protein
MSGFVVFCHLDAFSRQLFVLRSPSLDKQINELEDNANYYKEEIKNQKNIKQLKNPNR